MPTLAEFADALSEHIMHERGWTLEQATRWVMQHVENTSGALREG